MSRTSPTVDLSPLSWRLWLALSAGATLSGLLLSAIGVLQASGYLVVILAATAAAGLIWKQEFAGVVRKTVIRARRFRRPMPAGFLVLGVVAGIGGALYSPSNFDTLWYRMPRVLHWLAEHRWHWIHTHEMRFNVISTGIEWLWAPLIALSGSDRLLFIPNLISFFLMPGAVFSLFTRLGMRPRLAWWWMWLLPAAWVYAMQAGSAANDSFAVIYSVMMVDFALRARKSGRATDWAWSLIAAALLTNAKQSNAPLGLLWLVAAAPSWRLPLSRPILTVAAGTVAVLVSMLPTTAINWHHTGNWMGWTRDQQTWIPEKPLVGMVANTFFLIVHNAAPPFIPGSSRWNQLMEGIVNGPWAIWVRGFESFGNVPQAMSESWAGLGLPVSFMFLLSALAVWRFPRLAASTDLNRWIRWAIWPPFVVFLCKMGCRQLARYLAAYFPFLIAAVLTGGANGFLRRAWWRWLCYGTLFSSIALLLVSRQRPIFPTPAMTGWIAAHVPGAGSLERLRDKQLQHLSQGDRFDPFLPLLRDETVVGMAAYAVGEVKLWMPLGKRRVRHVRPEDSTESLKALGVRRVIVNDMAALVAGNRDGLDWIAKRGMRLVDCFPLSPAESKARSESGPALDLESLARPKQIPAPVDNLYLAEIPD